MNSAEPDQKVLVVDDDEALAKVMARTLRSRGFECDVALTGAEARALLEQKDYAVALLDVKLPDDSGYALLEEMRRTRPDTAVVMVSGVEDAELGKAALEHGAYAYHVKPVGATQLYLLVVNNLQRRNRELEHRASVSRLEGIVQERSQQMRRAAELQTGLLPTSPYRDEGFEVAAHFTPAREISGDFYDWYRTLGGRLVVSVGDVMGKGLQASLVMATARAALRGVAEVRPIDAALSQAAAVMSAALDVNHAFVTAFHCIFDPLTGAVEYVDAGHGHVRVLRGADSQELLAQRSAPIGIFPDGNFVAGGLALGQGDTLVMFSDGLYELRPDLATKDVVLPAEVRRAGSAQEMVELLAHGAREGQLNDDVTVVALRRM